MGDINAHVLEMRKLAVAEKQIEAGAFLSDQEIRARALECACALWDRMETQEFPKVFWVDVRTFEAYIRDGVT